MKTLYEFKKIISYELKEVLYQTKLITPFSKVLSVINENGKLVLYAEVETDHLSSRLEILLIENDGSIPNFLDLKYLGAVLSSTYKNTYHVYYRYEHHSSTIDVKQLRKDLMYQGFKLKYDPDKTTEH